MSSTNHSYSFNDSGINTPFNSSFSKATVTLDDSSILRSSKHDSILRENSYCSSVLSYEKYSNTPFRRYKSFIIDKNALKRNLTSTPLVKTSLKLQSFHLSSSLSSIDVASSQGLIAHNITDSKEEPNSYTNDEKHTRIDESEADYLSSKSPPFDSNKIKESTPHSFSEKVIPPNISHGFHSSNNANMRRLATLDIISRLYQTGCMNHVLTLIFSNLVSHPWTVCEASRTCKLWHEVIKYRGEHSILNQSVVKARSKYLQFRKINSENLTRTIGEDAHASSISSTNIEKSACSGKGADSVTQMEGGSAYYDHSSNNSISSFFYDVPSSKKFSFHNNLQCDPKTFQQGSQKKSHRRPQLSVVDTNVDKATKTKEMAVSLMKSDEIIDESGIEEDIIINNLHLSMDQNLNFKRKLFLEEAAKINNSTSSFSNDSILKNISSCPKLSGTPDYLQECPRCESPSRVRRKSTFASCCRCEYTFCLSCKCEVKNNSVGVESSHPFRGAISSSPSPSLQSSYEYICSCRPISNSPSKKTVHKRHGFITSKKSKCRLKRL